MLDCVKNIGNNLSEFFQRLDNKEKVFFIILIVSLAVVVFINCEKEGFWSGYRYPYYGYGDGGGYYPTYPWYHWNTWGSWFYPSSYGCWW